MAPASLPPPRTGRLPLHRAALAGHLVVLPLLGARGAIDMPDAVERWTPLHCSTWTGKADAVRFMFEHRLGLVHRGGAGSGDHPSSKDEVEGGGGTWASK